MSYLNTILKFSAGGSQFDQRKQQKAGWFPVNVNGTTVYYNPYENKASGGTGWLDPNYDKATQAYKTTVAAFKHQYEGANGQGSMYYRKKGTRRQFTGQDGKSYDLSTGNPMYTNNTIKIQKKPQSVNDVREDASKTSVKSGEGRTGGNPNGVSNTNLTVGKNQFAKGFGANDFKGANFNSRDDVRGFQEFASTYGWGASKSYNGKGFDGIAGSDTQSAWNQIDSTSGKTLGQLWLEKQNPELAKTNWQTEHNKQITEAQNKINDLNAQINNESKNLYQNPYNIQRIESSRNYGDNGMLQTDLSKIDGTNYFANNLSVGKRADRVNAYKQAQANNGMFTYTDNFGNTYTKDIRNMSRRSFRHFVDSIGGQQVADTNLSQSQIANRNNVRNSGTAGIAAGKGTGTLMTDKQAELQAQRNQAQADFDNLNKQTYTPSNITYGGQNLDKNYQTQGIQQWQQKVNDVKNNLHFTLENITDNITVGKQQPDQRIQQVANGAQKNGNLQNWKKETFQFKQGGRLIFKYTKNQIY